VGGAAQTGPEDLAGWSRSYKRFRAVYGVLSLPYQKNALTPTCPDELATVLDFGDTFSAQGATRIGVHAFRLTSGVEVEASIDTCDSYSIPLRCPLLLQVSRFMTSQH
jgi:hypothetical protein